MDNFLFASVYNLAFKKVWLDGLIIFFAAYWEYAVVVVLLFYLWTPMSKKAELRARAITMAGAVVSGLTAWVGVDSLIHYLYPREQPFVFEGLDALIAQDPLEPSFPSDHATFFMALAIYFLLSGHKKLGWFLLVSALLIGAARVAAGVHWPSDIFAGWLIGAAVSWGVYRFIGKKFK